MMSPTGGVIIVVAVWGVIALINMAINFQLEMIQLHNIIENQETIIQMLNSTETP